MVMSDSKPPPYLQGVFRSEEVSGGPLTGPKVEPLTDAELVEWLASHKTGHDFLWEDRDRLFATIADRDAQIAVLADRLKYYGHFVGLKLLPTSAKALLERVEKAERENTFLRGIAAKIMPCHYCGVDDIAKCPHGFPGCSLADDLMCADSETGTTVLKERARAEAAEARIEELSRTQRTPEWQPIETAPMDGTQILAYIPFAAVPMGKIKKVRPPHVASCYWAVALANNMHAYRKTALELQDKHHGYWSFDKKGRRPVYARPTHWMPLPPPPESK